MPPRRSRARKAASASKADENKGGINEDVPMLEKEDVLNPQGNVTDDVSTPGVRRRNAATRE